MHEEIDAEMDDDLCPEYDFSQMEGSVRGKYVERYQAGTNLVLLDPDVAKAFPIKDTVNETLPFPMENTQKQVVNKPVRAD